MKVISTHHEGNLELERKILEEDKKKFELEKAQWDNDKKEFEEGKILESLNAYLRPVTGLYLISVLLILCYLAVENYFALARPLIITTIIYIACAGGIGGTLSGMSSLSIHQEDFKRKYTFWYVFRPIGGIIIGVFVYFLLFANILVLNLPTDTVTPTSTLAYSAVAFLAGFATRHVTLKLKELSDALFGKYDSKPNETPEGEPGTNDKL